MLKKCGKKCLATLLSLSMLLLLLPTFTIVTSAAVTLPVLSTQTNYLSKSALDAGTKSNVTVNADGSTTTNQAADWDINQLYPSYHFSADVSALANKSFVVTWRHTNIGSGNGNKVNTVAQIGTMGDQSVLLGFSSTTTQIRIGTTNHKIANGYTGTHTVAAYYRIESNNLSGTVYVYVDGTQVGSLAMPSLLIPAFDMTANGCWYQASVIDRLKMFEAPYGPNFVAAPTYTSEYNYAPISKLNNQWAQNCVFYDSYIDMGNGSWGREAFNEYYGFVLESSESSSWATSGDYVISWTQRTTGGYTVSRIGQAGGVQVLFAAGGPGDYTCLYYNGSQVALFDSGHYGDNNYLIYFKRSVGTYGTYYFYYNGLPIGVWAAPGTNAFMYGCSSNYSYPRISNIRVYRNPFEFPIPAVGANMATFTKNTGLQDYFTGVNFYSSEGRISIDRAGTGNHYTFYASSSHSCFALSNNTSISGSYVIRWTQQNVTGGFANVRIAYGTGGNSNLILSAGNTEFKLYKEGNSTAVKSMWTGTRTDKCEYIVYFNKNAGTYGTFYFYSNGAYYGAYAPSYATRFAFYYCFLGATTNVYNVNVADVINNYNVIVNSATGGYGTGAATNVPYGTKVTLTAEPYAGYSFRHWIIGGRLYQKNNVQIAVNGNVTATPVFTANSPGVYSINFFSSDGRYISTFKSNAFNPATDLPAVPPRYGYTANGWGYVWEDTITSDIDVYPQYIKSGSNYTISVTNGTADRTSVKFETQVTVRPTTESGFLYWKDENSRAVSVDKKYTFFATRSTTLTAVYSGDKPTVITYVNPTSCNVSTSSSQFKMTIVGSTYAASGYNIVERGIIYKTGNSNNLKIGADGVKQKVASTVKNGQFMYTLNNAPKNTDIYACVYMINSSGGTQRVYYSAVCTCRMNS